MTKERKKNTHTKKIHRPQSGAVFIPNWWKNTDLNSWIHTWDELLSRPSSRFSSVVFQRLSLLNSADRRKECNNLAFLFFLSCDQRHETANHLTAPNDCQGKQITLDYTDMLSQTHKHTHTQIYREHQQKSHWLCICFHIWGCICGKQRQTDTHAHTQNHQVLGSLSGVINSHSNPINTPVNTTFWSSIVKSMKSAINPELTLIRVPPLSQLQRSLIVWQ